MSDTAALQATWQDAAEEVAGIGFWRMDPSTGAVDWTPNMFRLFEFPVGPAPNAQETMSRIHPDDRADAYIDLFLGQSPGNAQGLLMKLHFTRALGKVAQADEVMATLQAMQARGQLTVGEQQTLSLYLEK